MESSTGIAYQVGPLLPQIVQGLAQGRLGRGFGAGLICPYQQSVQNRSLQFQSLGIAFSWHQFHDSVLALSEEFESRGVLDGSQTNDATSSPVTVFESRVVLDGNCIFRNWQAYSYIL